jgi:hypothetical protein
MAAFSRPSTMALVAERMRRLRARSIAVRSEPIKASAIWENVERLDRNQLDFYRMSQPNGSLLHVSGSARSKSWPDRHYRPPQTKMSPSKRDITYSH